MVLLLWLVVTTAAAFDFPPLTGRIVDQVHLLSPQARDKLEVLLKEHEDKTGNQVVVVSVPSLQGRSIEEYGVELGRHWGIGQKDKNNGVILLIAPNERQARIEVGYGLEGTLTDALSSIIISRRLIPAFKNGDYDGGITSGAEGILSILDNNVPDDLKEPVATGNISSLFVPLMFFIVFVSFLMPSNNTFFFSLFYSAIGAIGVGLMAQSILYGLLAGGVLFLVFYFDRSRSIGRMPYIRGGSFQRSRSFTGGGGTFGGGGSSGRW
jgi:uncharacterized protein